MKIADSHCDALANYGSIEGLLEGKQWGLNRFKKFGVLQYLAVFTPPEREGAEAVSYAVDKISLFLGLRREKGVHLVKDSLVEGKTNLLLSFEGASPLKRDPQLLYFYHELGLRCLGLTWNHRNNFADGLEVGSGGGLTKLGRTLLRIAEKLNVCIDVSHLSERCFWEVMEYDVPVIATHSNFKGVWEHPRNLSDEQVKAVVSRGGHIGLNFVKEFLGGTVDALVRHFEYAVVNGWEDHVGLGGDLEGCTLHHDFGENEWEVYNRIEKQLEAHPKLGKFAEGFLWANLWNFTESYLRR